MSEPIRPGAAPEEELPEPPRLRALRRMVTLLTGVLIVGVIVIAASLALRLAAAPAAPAFDPRAIGAERLVLPLGEAVTALGGAGGALLVATRDAAGAERLRVYDAATGESLRAIALERAE